MVTVATTATYPQCASARCRCSSIGYMPLAVAVGGTVGDGGTRVAVAVGGRLVSVGRMVSGAERISAVAVDVGCGGVRLRCRCQGGRQGWRERAHGGGRLQRRQRFRVDRDRLWTLLERIEREQYRDGRDQQEFLEVGNHSVLEPFGMAVAGALPPRHYRKRESVSCETAGESARESFVDREKTLKATCCARRAANSPESAHIFAPGRDLVPIGIELLSSATRRATADTQGAHLRASSRRSIHVRAVCGVGQQGGYARR